MTHSQIKQALESVLKILETVEQDPEFRAIARDEEADPELATDMGDALHYVGEMIGKLGEMQERQQKITRKYRIFNGRVTRTK
jgi:hypothetical protein